MIFSQTFYQFNLNTLNDISYASDPVIKQNNFDKDAREYGEKLLEYMYW